MGSLNLNKSKSHTQNRWQESKREEANLREAALRPTRGPESSSQSADATGSSSKDASPGASESVLASSWPLPSSTSPWRSSIWRANALTSTRRGKSSQDTSSSPSAMTKSSTSSLPPPRSAKAVSDRTSRRGSGTRRNERPETREFSRLVNPCHVRVSLPDESEARTSQ